MGLIPAFIYRRIQHRPNLLKIVENLGWLFFDKILRMGVGLFIIAWVARYLGPQQFGLFSFATSFVSLFVAVAGLGLQNIVVRDIVREPDGKYETLGTAAILMLFGGLIAYCCILISIFLFRPNDILAQIMVAIIGSTMVLKASDVAVYWFEAQILSKYTVWVQNGCFLLFASFKIALIISNAPLVAFAWVILLEAIIVSLMMLFMLGKNGLQLKKLYFSPSRAKVLLKQSCPLLISGISIGLAMRIDQIMIGLMLTDLSVGVYSVGVRLAEVFVFIGVIIVNTFFPRLVNLSEDKFEFEFIKLIRWPFYGLLILAGLVSITSSLTVPAFFGVEYIESAPVLSVVIFSIPLTYLSMISYSYLLRKELHGEILFRQLFGLFINVIINFHLIPVYGVIGAALATLIADFLISICLDIGRNNYKNLCNMKLRALLFMEKIKI